MNLQQTLAQLAAEDRLDDGTRSLVWGAFEGDEPLARAVDGEQIEPATAEEAARTAPVWLSAIGIEGFRGIGARTELLLNPQPGLTLVVGRNGSGKSSFAEGLEALLTGDNLRWQGRPKAWQEGWRNLHHSGPTSVSAELQLEGATAPVALVRSWAETFEASTIEGHCEDAPIDFAELGWEEPLTSYKPFLSYNELGSMLEEKPSAVYDSMAAVLGLDRVAEARNRLRQARLEAQKPAKELDKARTVLMERLASSTEPRAIEARAALEARTPDVGQLDTLVFGDGPARSPHVAALSQLPDLEADRCHHLTRSLSLAIQARHSAADVDSARSGRLAALLRLALDHHGHEGDGPCPVCGRGTLDEAWRARAAVEAESLERTAEALRQAERDLAAARRDAQDAIVAVPRAVTAVANAEPEAEILHSRWLAWCTPPDGGWTDDTLVARLADVGDLNAAIGTVRAAAGKVLAAQDDEWRPLARQLSAWAESARAAAEATATAKRLKKGEDFLKRAEATIRAERFQPIAEASSRLWTRLRQQSNVNLERVALEGQTTSRRVDLDVTVDGTETSALGVMSQGELHALALALFLPRVTAAESPFRFVMIDDPVQAMDPARVDGLAGVLAAVAAERQVIVFTHDDRLPASCRRLDIEAEIIEISRQTGSRVTASVSYRPAEKAITDAKILARTERLPASLKRQIVPIHCRRALEAQVRDLVWRHLLADGRTHGEIDQLIDDATRTTDLLALLLLGTPSSTDDVYGRLNAVRPGAAKQLRFLNSAVHEPQADLDPEALTATVRNLMTALREWAS